MPTVAIKTKGGGSAGEISLSDRVFGAPRNLPLMHQAVRAELENSRQDTRNAPGRGDMLGGGKKPFRQKGTGRSRQGSTVAPQWRKGGAAHGPHPRDLEHSLPKKMRRQAIRAALSAKLADGELVIVDSLPIGDVPKTKPVAEFLSSVAADAKKVLVIVEAHQDNVWKSLRNIGNVTVRFAPQFSTRDVVNGGIVVITRAAAEKIDATWGPEERNPDSFSPIGITSVEVPTGKPFGRGRSRESQIVEARHPQSAESVIGATSTGSAQVESTDSASRIGADSRVVATQKAATNVSPTSTALERGDGMKIEWPIENPPLFDVPVRIFDQETSNFSVRTLSELSDYKPGEYKVLSLLPDGSRFSGSLLIRGPKNVRLNWVHLNDSIFAFEHKGRVKSMERLDANTSPLVVCRLFGATKGAYSWQSFDWLNASLQSQGDITYRIDFPGMETDPMAIFQLAEADHWPVNLRLPVIGTGCSLSLFVDGFGGIGVKATLNNADADALLSYYEQGMRNEYIALASRMAKTLEITENFDPIVGTVVLTIMSQEGDVSPELVWPEKLLRGSRSFIDGLVVLAQFYQRIGREPLATSIMLEVLKRLTTNRATLPLLSESFLILLKWISQGPEDLRIGYNSLGNRLYRLADNLVPGSRFLAYTGTDPNTPNQQSVTVNEIASSKENRSQYYLTVIS